MRGAHKGAKFLAPLVVAALGLTACGGSGNGDSADSAGSGGAGGSPIKIGTAIDLSGPVAGTGKDALAGMRFAVDQLNAGDGVLGRKVELVSKDNQSKPDVAVTEARDLVQSDHVVALMAPASSAGALAVSTAVSKPFKIPLFTHSSNTDALTVKSFQPYIFSLGPNALMESNAQAQALAKKDYVRYGLLAADYEGGHSNIEAFKKYMKKYNPKAEFVTELYPPLGEKDYTSYINRILSAKPDFVFSVLYGGDLIAFTKQANAVGFFDKVPFTALYDSTTLRTLGKDAPEGTRGYGRGPFFALNSEAAKKFVDAFKSKNGDYPSVWSVLAYDCVMTWAQGVESAKSTDSEKLVDALENMTVHTLRGDVTFRKVDHQANVPEYYGFITQTSPYGFPIWKDTQEIDNILIPEAEVRELRGQ